MVLYCFPSNNDTTIIQLSKSVPVNKRKPLEKSVRNADIQFTVNGKEHAIYWNEDTTSSLSAQCYYTLGKWGKNDRLQLQATATGLLSSQGWEGSEYYHMRTGETMQWKGSPCFLNIPVHIGYKLSLGHNTALFAHVGPYIGIGLFGKNKLVTDAETGKKTTATISNNVFSDKQLDRFDWGIGGKIGVEFAGHVQIALGYDWGLKNLKTSTNPIDFKNKVFSVSCAYLF